MVWCSREKIGQRERECVCAHTEAHTHTHHRQGRDSGDVLCFGQTSLDMCASLAGSALDIECSSLLSQGSSKYGKNVVMLAFLFDSL